MSYSSKTFGASQTFSEKLQELDVKKQTVLRLNSEEDWTAKKSTLIKFIFEIESSVAQLSQSMKILEEQNATLLKELETANRERTAMMRDLNKCQDFTNELKASMAHMNGTCRNAEGINNRLHGEINELYRNLEDAEVTLREQIMSNKELLEENKELSVRLKKIEIKNEELIEDNIILTARERDLNNMITELEIKFDMQSNKIAKLEGRPASIGKIYAQGRMRKFRKLNEFVDRILALDGCEGYLKEKMGSDIINKLTSGTISDSLMNMVERNLCSFESMHMKRRVRSSDTNRESKVKKVDLNEKRVEKKVKKMKLNKSLTMLDFNDPLEDLMKSRFAKKPWKSSFDKFKNDSGSVEKFKRNKAKHE